MGGVVPAPATGNAIPVSYDRCGPLARSSMRRFRRHVPAIVENDPALVLSPHDVGINGGPLLIAVTPASGCDLGIEPGDILGGVDWLLGGLLLRRSGSARCRESGQRQRRHWSRGPVRGSRDSCYWLSPSTLRVKGGLLS